MTIREVAFVLAGLVSFDRGWGARDFAKHWQRNEFSKHQLVISAVKSQIQSHDERILKRLDALAMFLLALNPTVAFCFCGSYSNKLAAVYKVSASRALCPMAKCVAVIAGPTGVGKSDLAIRLCEQMQGEIISVDSVQVYRNLVIGANKPTVREVERVPHHLLNVRESNEEYTAGDFYNDALQAVQDVLSRGRLPVLVGGTSMYLDWFTNGRPDTPMADPVVKDQVRELLAPFKAAADWENGVAKLQEVDPESATQLVRNDWYRLNRYLTIAMQTKNSTVSPPSPAEDDLTKLRNSLDMRCFFLTAPREQLFRRIDRRCEAMLQSGLLEETTEQLLDGSLLPSSSAGRAIGYRQAIEYLTKKKWRYALPTGLTKFVKDFATQSRQYAAKQTRWFRTERKFEWVPVDWDLPEAAERKLIEHIQCDREEFDRALGAPCQAELREQDRNDKSTETYLPRLPKTIDRRAARDELLERADMCRQRLEEYLPNLRAIDAELAERYPYTRSQA